MNSNKNILITGGAGCIGSSITKVLNNHGYHNLILCDNFGNPEKEKNLEGKVFRKRIHVNELSEFLSSHGSSIDFVIHFGARAGAYALDKEVLQKYNVDFSKQIWHYCTEYQIPLIYASTGATYGSGEGGHIDDDNLLSGLVPINEYALSKHHFDLWASQQKNHPPFWAGLKFFNVYGPNEYHKDRRASMVYHCYRQIRETGKATLFGSFNPAIPDGDYKRDLIYLMDILDVCYWFFDAFINGTGDVPSGIYNIGTGVPRSFNDIAHDVFKALHLEPQIEYKPVPEEIRSGYPECNFAVTDKLRKAGYTRPFTSLEDGITEYVNNYLLKEAYF